MMTPHKSGGRGTYLIDRRYPGVGRIRRASGTRDAKLFKKLVGMLDELQAKPEYLKAIRDGRMKALEVWAAYQLYGLSRLPVLGEGRLMAPALRDWVRKLDIAPETRHSYRSCIKRITDAAPRRALVGDLPRILRKLRDEMPRSRMFNLTRSTLCSFAKHEYGRHSPLWAELANVPTYSVTKRVGRPCTPDQARKVAEKLARLGGMWWTMCCTGMGPKEYWDTPWDIEADRIRVHGTKRAGRHRTVPRMSTPIRPLVGLKTYRRALNPLGYQPYDARRTYEGWMKAAGIPKWRRRKYMGHAPKDVTDGYGDEFPLDEFLAQDADRLREYVGRDWAVRLAVMP